MWRHEIGVGVGGWDSLYLIGADVVSRHKECTLGIKPLRQEYSREEPSMARLLSR